MDFISQLFLDHSQAPAVKEKWFWKILPFGFLTICIIFLEGIQPFYFTQDDNLVQFLPVILDFCRHLEYGNFSTYNPYPVMGIPTVSSGIYSLLYPLTPLSYFISKYLLQNEYLTLEVFAIIHLYLGFVATKKLLKTLGVDPLIGSVAALSFLLSGYSLIGGRSWYYMLPHLLWTPLLFYSFLKLWNTHSLKYLLISGCTLGFPVLSGNTQLWVYNLLFVLITFAIVCLTQPASREKISATLSAVGLGLAIAAPFLFLQYTVTKTMPDSVWGNGISKGIDSMLLPFPFALSAHPNGWGNTFKELQGQLFYSGTLFTAIGLFSIGIVCLSFFLIHSSKLRLFYFSNVWLICGAIAFLFALGNEGFLWSLFSRIMPFNKFSNPFKFLHFVNFFFAIGGSLVLQRIFSNYLVNYSWARHTILLTTILLLGYHVTLCKSSFYTYNFKPYPALSKNLQAIQSERRRIFLLTQEKYSDSTYIHCLPFNTPAVYRIPSLHGYDNFAKEYLATTHFNRSISPETLYDYGVSYLLSYKEKLPADFIKHCSIYYQEKDCTLWKLNKNASLAFAQEDSTRNIELRYLENGMELNISELIPPKKLVINYAYYPDFTAWADEKEASVAQDAKGRILVNISEPASTLHLRYQPKIWPGLIASAILLVLTCLFAVVGRSKRKSVT